MRKSRVKFNREHSDNLRHWHSYGLQRLNASRFIHAVDDILDNKSILISPRSQKVSGGISNMAVRRARLANL